MNPILKITQGVTRHPDYRMKEPVDICIEKGEQIAIVGANGSGKSRLVDIMTGKLPLLMNEVVYDFSPSPYKLVSDNLKYITFRDSYGESDGTYYYQQRWNQHDIDDKIPTAGKLLEEAFQQAEKQGGYGLDEAQKEMARQRRRLLKEKLYEMFHLETLLDKKIILLSSGELRKFQLTRTLLSGPRMLIMDNPYIGLDAQTRCLLTRLFETLIQETDLQIILVLSRRQDIPELITHVVPVADLTVGRKMTREDYLAQQNALDTPAEEWGETDRLIREMTEKNREETTDTVLKMNHVSIRYGSRTILKDLDWCIRNEEKWALSGENGAGKSTLLSLVCADNPQSYACDMELFGRKRGSGESIWDIKKKIGYVSPEMHRAYLKNLPALDIVSSGLNDSVGLFVRTREQEKEICRQWMQIFGIRHLADKHFLKLSSGEQRMCLLARAFVKSPQLLVLDEPLHGLDNKNRRLVKHIIDTYCRYPNKTLVMVTHYEEDLPPVVNKKWILKKNS